MEKPAASLDGVESTWSCQLSLTEYFHYQNQEVQNAGSCQGHHIKVNGAKGKAPTRKTIFTRR